MSEFIVNTVIGTTLESMTFLYAMYYLLEIRKKKKGQFFIFLVLWILLCIGTAWKIPAYSPFINFSVAIIVLTWISKESLFKVFFAFLVITMLLVILQLLFIPVYHIFDSNIFAMLGIMGAIFVILVFLLSKFGDELKDQIQKYENKYINYLGINLIIFSFLFKIIYDFDNQILTDNFVYFIFLMLIVLTINYYTYLEIGKIRERGKLLEVQEEIRLPLEQMLTEVKTKQHEYKNHLTTILGILETSTPEDASSKIKNFLTDLYAYDSMDGELLNSDRDIVKAVLYMKHNEAIAKAIDFSISIKCSLKSIRVLDYELSILMNNLLNNAFEAVEGKSNRNVYCEMGYDEREELFYCLTKNTGETLSPEILSKLADKNFTTKSGNQGYGLWSVQALCKKYHGKLQIYYEGDLIVIKALFS